MFIDKTKISIRRISNDVARDMIRKYHYTKNLNGCKYALGVYYKTSTNGFFDIDEELVGVIVYAHPVSNKTVDSICGPSILKNDEVLELVRLYVKDLPNDKNIESFVIGQSFEWLRANDPKVKVLISYADPEVGHTGRIYRATNWLYQGCGISKLMPDYSIKLTEDGEWIHSRSVASKFGNKNIKSLAKRIGHTFWQKEDSSKHRYIYFLTDKRETKRLKKMLKLPILPYSEIKHPTQVIRKVYVKDGEVEKIEVLQGEDTGWKRKK
jgi:hypothetical protein